MPKFTFQLDGVLRHREHQEKARQRELGVCLADLAKLEAEMRELTAAAEASTDDLRANHLVGKIDVNFLTAHRRHMMAVQRRSGALAQKIAQAQRAVDDSRKQLAE